MALTANFKKFMVILVLVGGTGVAGFVGSKHNYWGILDKKEQPAQTVETEPQQAPVTYQQPVQAPVQQQEYQQPTPAPVQQPAQQVQQVQQDGQQPAQHKAAIDKMGALDKL